MKSTLLVLLLLPALLQAQWSNDPDENTPVTLFTSQPELVTDGENGVIILSHSRDVNPIIRAQHLSVNGELMWPGAQGVGVSDAEHAQWLRRPSGDRKFVLSDSAEGAFVAYSVGRIVGHSPEIGDLYASSVFVQRLDSFGNRLWGEDGLRLMPILPDTFEFSQFTLNMIPDGREGIYILWWVDGFDSTQYNGVYHNRIDKDGNPQWPNRRLTERTGTDYIPYLDPERNINLYEYSGETVPPGGRPDRFLKIDAISGESLRQREIEIGTGEHGFNAFYDYDGLPNGTAIFGFNDFRGDTLRVQKLDGDGQPLWGTLPRIVGHGLITRVSFELQRDNAAGAYLWYHTRDSVLHIVHVDGGGDVDWRHEFGVEQLGDFARTIGRYVDRPMTVSPDGSAFILTDGFQTVNKFSITGEVIWETRISNRAALVAGIDDFTALADADGGCTVVWEEVGSFVGLRAQRVDRHGTLGGATPVRDSGRGSQPHEFHLHPPAPNPFYDTVTLSYSLNQTTAVKVTVYDLLGREVITLTDVPMQRPGEYSIAWDGRDKTGLRLPSGLYLIRMQSRGHALTQKIVLLK